MLLCVWPGVLSVPDTPHANDVKTDVNLQSCVYIWGEAATEKQQRYTHSSMHLTCSRDVSPVFFMCVRMHANTYAYLSVCIWWYEPPYPRKSDLIIYIACVNLLLLILWAHCLNANYYVYDLVLSPLLTHLPHMTCRKYSNLQPCVYMRGESATERGPGYTQSSSRRTVPSYECITHTSLCNVLYVCFSVMYVI